MIPMVLLFSKQTTTTTYVKVLVTTNHSYPLSLRKHFTHTPTYHPKTNISTKFASITQVLVTQTIATQYHFFGILPNFVRFMIMMWFAIYFYTITRERRSMDYYVQYLMLGMNLIYQKCWLKVQNKDTVSSILY